MMEKQLLVNDPSNELTDIYIQTILKTLKGDTNEAIDFSKPQLNPIFQKVYPFFIFAYAKLIILSTLAHILMMYNIFKNSLHNDPTCAFLVNIAIASIMHLVFVLPVTLCVMLFQNWIFGHFLCFCLPILQDMPIHVTMLTYLLIAIDRYRFVSDPRKPRIPAFVCALGTWFFAICIALPHPIYTTYLDFEALTKQAEFHGLELCMANLTDDIQDYMRSLFIGTYVAPLTIMAYLFVKSSQELENQEAPLAIAVFGARAKNSCSRQSSYASNDIAITIHRKHGNENLRSNGTALTNFSSPYDADENELNVQKEKRTQKYLILMASSFVVCLCPLMILRLAKSSLEETYENTSHFDITYLVFVWLAFLPTLILPCLYACWQMNRSIRDRLRGYFQFSNRQNQEREISEQDTVVLECTSRQQSMPGPYGVSRSRTGSGNSSKDSYALSRQHSAKHEGRTINAECPCYSNAIGGVVL